MYILFVSFDHDFFNPHNFDTQRKTNTAMAMLFVVINI